MEFDELVENWKMFNTKIKWEDARYYTIDMQKCKNRRFRPIFVHPPEHDQNDHFTLHRSSCLRLPCPPTTNSINRIGITFYSVRSH